MKLKIFVEYQKQINQSIRNIQGPIYSQKDIESYNSDIIGKTHFI